MNETAAEPLAQRRFNDLKVARSQMAEVPREAVQGYPIPFVHEGDLWFGAIYFLRVGRPPDPPKVTLPGWIARIDERTGKTVQVMALENDLSETVGPHVLPRNMDMAAFREAEARMLAALSELLNVARYPDRALTPEEVAAAKAFLAEWTKISHKPLRDEYRKINPDWFALIEAAE